MAPRDRAADLAEAARFHGHKCPALVFGARASSLAMERLDFFRQRYDLDDMVAVAEGDSCLVDAVQAITGCTVGKGNLLIRPWGKIAVSFLNRSTGRGLRLAVSPEAMENSGFQDFLNEKGRTVLADQDRRTVRKNLMARLAEIASWVEAQAPETLFAIREFAGKAPPFARVSALARCDSCGEYLMEVASTKRGAAVLCPECLENSRSRR